MTLSPELTTFGQYLAGKFDNKVQALANPVWYVHLHLWLRPVPLFPEDSLTLYAEQANIVKLDQPYRPRLWRLRQHGDRLEVQHYRFHDITKVLGAGRNPDLLRQITREDVEVLTASGCTLNVTVTSDSDGNYQFKASPPDNIPCCFSTHQNQPYQILLGFEVTSQTLQTYDKGIDPKTGKPIWGALMGPYCFDKQENFPFFRD